MLNMKIFQTIFQIAQKVQDFQSSLPSKLELIAKPRVEGPFLDNFVKIINDVTKSTSSASRCPAESIPFKVLR